MSESDRLLSLGRVLGSGEPVRRSATEPPSGPSGPPAQSIQFDAGERRNIGQELRELQQQELDLRLQLQLQEGRSRVASLQERLRSAGLPHHTSFTPSAPTSPVTSHANSSAPTSSVGSFAPPSTDRTRVKAPEAYFGKSIKEHSNFV